MCYQIYMGITLAVVFAIIGHGDALKCWTCNSNQDFTCRDYFNVEKFLEKESKVVNENSQQQPVIKEPHLNLCDETKYNYDYKNVCIKRVVRKADNGPVNVIRECRLVPRSLNKGECPDIEKDDTELKFCGTCDYDGCNLANATRSNAILAAALSAVLMLLLRC